MDSIVVTRKGNTVYLVNVSTLERVIVIRLGYDSDEDWTAEVQMQLVKMLNGADSIKLTKQQCNICRVTCNERPKINRLRMRFSLALRRALCYTFFVRQNTGQRPTLGAFQ